MEFSVDGVVASRDTASPYKTTIDMRPFGTGVHTVTATVTDMVGRRASDSATVRVIDVSVPSITSVSGSPNPFFPIKRDHYRDNFTVRFRLSERAAVAMAIYAPAGGAPARIITTRTRNAGWNTIVWNGRTDAGGPSVGTWRYRLVAHDGINTSKVTAIRSVKIRSYIIKKVRHNVARIVYH